MEKTDWNRKIWKSFGKCLRMFWWPIFGPPCILCCDQKSFKCPARGAKHKVYQILATLRFLAMGGTV